MDVRRLLVVVTGLATGLDLTICALVMPAIQDQTAKYVSRFIYSNCNKYEHKK